MNLSIEQQRKKCAKNIRVGNTYLMRATKNSIRQSLSYSGTGSMECRLIAFARHLYGDYWLFATNAINTNFWSMEYGSNKDAYTKTKVSADFNHYKYGWWLNSSEIELMTIKRVSVGP